MASKVINMCVCACVCVRVCLFVCSPLQVTAAFSFSRTRMRSQYLYIGLCEQRDARGKEMDAPSSYHPVHITCTHAHATPGRKFLIGSGLVYFLYKVTI